METFGSLVQCSRSENTTAGWGSRDRGDYIRQTHTDASERADSAFPSNQTCALSSGLKPMMGKIGAADRIEIKMESIITNQTTICLEFHSIQLITIMNIDLYY